MTPLDENKELKKQNLKKKGEKVCNYTFLLKGQIFDIIEGNCPNCGSETENGKCTNMETIGSLLKCGYGRGDTSFTNMKKQKKKKKEILKEKEDIPYCGDCGNKMKKSKYRNGPAYWCPCFVNNQRY